MGALLEGGTRGKLQALMRFRFRPAALLLPLLAWVVTPGGALAVLPSPDASASGPGLLRMLGPGATSLFAPVSGTPSALVALPPGADASTFGLDPVGPGIGRVRGSREAVLAFADAHPTLHLELAPPLHLLNDNVGKLIRAREAHAAGVTGAGVLVGVADTGIDTQHPDFLDDAGKSRVRWLLDFSQPPAGIHTDIEARYSVYIESTNQRFGAVYTGADLDALHAGGDAGAVDVVGHGSHVTGIAAGDGGNPGARSPYAGVAPDAGLLIVRLTRGTSQSIENDDLVRAVSFMFERADAEKQPCVVNMSLGSDFGPHDGSSLWEQAIVQTVGADKPGHVLVAAAGNSGAAPVLPIHQSVHVVKDTRTLVPIDSGDEGGSVSVWINFRNATGMRVGLIGPGGEEWIAPQADGQAAGHNVGSGASQYNAAVVHGGSAPSSPIASGSQAAVVGWQGNWPKGTYRIVLEGEGSAELYLQAVSAIHGNQAAFLGGIREGTINLPADHPTMLAVGATVNRPGWTSKGGQDIRVRAPTFDAAGDVALDDAADLGEGDVAFFSSAGPNALGVPKPEIAAPGAVVASVLSGQARPDTALSIFSGTRCPPDRRTGQVDPLCMLVDDQHAVTSGTSMAAPVVAGAVALLLQRDPTLTQGEAVALIQAGAHPHRGLAPYAAQSSPGELDVVGSLAALARMHDPKLALPSSAASWVSLGGDYWDASSGTEMQALLELRNERGEPADLFDASRLQADVRIGDEPQASPPIERLAPGLYRYRALAPAGRGGQLASFGARFDGQPVVQVKTIPIGLDGWRSRYPTTLGGGCTLHAAGAPASLLPGLAVAALLLARRRQRSSARVTTAPCGSKLI